MIRCLYDPTPVSSYQLDFDNYAEILDLACLETKSFRLDLDGLWEGNYGVR